MLPAIFLVAATTLGGVWADVCERHSRLPPVLVTAAQPRPTVYAWPEERVELHCRPSQPGGCRWVKGSSQLATGCRLTTTHRGIITCKRGEETCGSIELNTPPSQDIEKKNWRRSSYSYHYQQRSDRYWQYGGQRYWSHKSSTFLCSQSGTIIRDDHLCDGSRHCDGGEDEWNCKPSCGPPFVSEHGALSSEPLTSYRDGSEVTHVCDPGFSFDESLSGLKRTCGAGRWTAHSPICRRNVALNRTVSFTGQPMTGCETAVDGKLGTWCMFVPNGAQQMLTVHLSENTTVTKVLVRALNNRYTVTLRDANQTSEELNCPCSEISDTLVSPAVSGVRICTCPEKQVEGKTRLLVRADSGAFMSLSVAEIVALEDSDVDVDECILLGHPAHGQFEPAGPGKVKLSCDPGHSPSCSDVVQCSAIRSGSVRLSCLEASCSQPPAIPNTNVIHNNGTTWQSVAEYGCKTGYALYPAEQNTTSSCGSDGLWSTGHISCLPESDIRVVAMKLGQQHERGMAALRAELLAGQQQVLAKQNSMQDRLSKLERDVALLGLAEGAYIRTAEAVTAEAGQAGADSAGPELEGLGDGAVGVARRLEALEQQMEVQAERAQEEAAVKLEQQLRAATESGELEEEAAELVQLSEPEAAFDAEVDLIQ